MPGSRFGQTLLKTLALTVALLFLFGTVVTAGWQFLFGTKVGQLFGMSAEALAGDAPQPRAEPALDGGSAEAATTEDASAAANPATSAPDAGDEAPPLAEPRFFDASKAGVFREERVFMPASKSMGGLGLPGAQQGLGGLGTRHVLDAGP